MSSSVMVYPPYIALTVFMRSTTADRNCDKDQYEPRKDLFQEGKLRLVLTGKSENYFAKGEDKAK